MLLDTAGLLAYHQGGEDAEALFKASDKKITHSYVLSEFVTLAHARGLPRVPALNFVVTLLEHPLVEVIWVGNSLHRDAMALLKARPDKNDSLCDAVSFVLMKERGITEALTTGHHFEQEGFRRLL